MELSLFNFLFNVNDKNWREKFQSRFVSYYKTYLDDKVLTQDEYKNINFLLENWISTMIYQTLYCEESTHVYEEFQVVYKFPRYILKANISLMRAPLDPSQEP